MAVVDIRMPPTFTHDGAAAALELKTAYPQLGVLLLSQAVETHFASQLLDLHEHPTTTAGCSRSSRRCATVE